MPPLTVTVPFVPLPSDLSLPMPASSDRPVALSFPAFAPSLCAQMVRLLPPKRFTAMPLVAFSSMSLRRMRCTSPETLMRKPFVTVPATTY